MQAKQFITKRFMKYHYSYHILLVAVVMLLLQASCTSKPKKFVIGVSQCSQDTWREKLNDELRTGEYLNDSITVRLASANDDSRLQKQQIRELVDAGVDLLIVSPNQMDDLASAIDQVYDQGIPVVLFDRKTTTGKYTAFIGGDNVVAGRVLAKYIAQRLEGKGRIVEITGAQGASAAIERHQAFMEVMKDYPGIQVVATEEGDWKQESGARAMRRILQKTKDFDFVFAHNDRMGLGAYQEARRQGLHRNYKYVGIDGMATPDGGLQLVRQGIFEATYVYPTQGDDMLKLAMRILTNQPFKRDNYLQTSIVTKENADLSIMEAKDSERQRKNLDMLHAKVDSYIASYNNQTIILWIMIAFFVFIIVAVVLIYRNYIVKARLSEQLAKKNAELERLNGEVMELTHSRLVFFTNVSHELRTPLTLIADPVELLLEDKSIKGQSRDLLKMVKRNADSLQYLVNSILDFRKLQNGKMELRLNRFDLSEALRLWTDDFRITTQRKQISLHVDTAGFSAEEEVVADKEKVGRIVFNLLSNALKYTPAGGDIFVALQDAGTDRWQLRVRDTGKGIAAKEQAKLFERFFQAKGAIGGTGIGLALVKSFAELHQGTVRVESEAGKGSCFTVVIPRKVAGKIAEDNLEASHVGVDGNVLPYIDDGNKREGKLQQLIGEHTDKPTLLIIDDNTDIRQYERTILQTDYFVMEASDGQEGLEVARREVPDLVVCDVMMPVMDGYAFCEKLKTTTATSHIPVIMLTAKNLDEQRVEGYSHGADSYITKPFSSKVLLARIENLLKSRSHLRAVFQQASSALAQPVEQDMSQLEDRDKEFVKKLHDIISRHLSDSDFNVESIGPMVGLSRVQLYRKVKAMTGTSVVDLIRKARLQKARRLLETTKKTVSEVAYDVGFSSPSYFAKCFKDEYGMKPGEVNEG